MKNLFVVNPASDSIDIRDGIDERIMKLKSLIGTLMLAVGCLNKNIAINIETVYDNLGIASLVIDEIEQLLTKLETS